MYDYVIVTHLPAFYKVNLYNEIAKTQNIYVIFIASNTDEKRSDDFTDLNNVIFKFEILNKNAFQSRKKIESIIKLNRLLKTIDYKKILVSGWDLVEFWFIIFTVAKRKNCLALESTIVESSTHGIKGYAKKFFLYRIAAVFASGTFQLELLKKLNYKRNIIITRGVGIINKPAYKKVRRSYKKNFLFIGRLSPEKNLKLLIKVFNDLPGHAITIIGNGLLEKELKSLANGNINFIGHIENNKLENFFLQSSMLILPSISEPWGLVTEEALYFGLPVIVSKNCGSSELIAHGINGFIIDPIDCENFKKTVLGIDDNTYSKLLNGVKKFSINEKDLKQINAYK